MKILLCMIHNMADKLHPFNTGLAYISATLKQVGYNVKNFVWDISSNAESNIEALKESIGQSDIDVVMTGGNLFEQNELGHVIKTAKSASASIKTIMGGAFVTYSPIEAMTIIPECDIGVIGEGEITICELTKALENNSRIDSVEGLVYKGGGGYIATPTRKELPDLSSLPIPDYEGFFGNWLNDHNAYTITSGRGCNHSCTFCTKFNKGYRERPLEKLFEELDHYSSKYRIKYIYLMNEYFNTDSRYLDVFCDKFKKYNIPVKLLTRISPNLTLSALHRLKDCGVQEILFGLESADDTVLKSMKKGVTVELMLRVLKDVKSSKINVQAPFIFGDTVETKDTVERTLSFIRDNRDLIRLISLGMIRLFPGSALYERAVLAEKIDPLSHISNQCPVVNVSQLSDEEYDYYDNYFPTFIDEVFNSDLNVENVSFTHIEKSSFDVKYSCRACGRLEQFGLDVLRPDPKRASNYTLSHFCDCGELLCISIFGHIINPQKIIETIKSAKTAFYGIGHLFYNIYTRCGLHSYRENQDFYLINGNVFRYPALLRSSSSLRALNILSPEAIGSLNIEKVIVTILGGYNLDEIVNELSLRYPDTEFVRWYEV